MLAWESNKNQMYAIYKKQDFLVLFKPCAFGIMFVFCVLLFWFCCCFLLLLLVLLAGFAAGVACADGCWCLRVLLVHVLLVLLALLVLVQLVHVLVVLLVLVNFADLRCAMRNSCFDFPSVALTFLKWPCPWGALTLPELL